MAVLNLSFKVVDSEGMYSTVLVHFNESELATVADAQAAATVIAGKLNGISGCSVVGITAEFPLTAPVDGGGVDAGSRVDAGATLSFYNTSGRAWSMYIPGFLTSKMESGVVTASDSNVAGFIATMTTGADIDDDVTPTDGNELQLQAYRKGFQSTRKTRR